MPCDRRIILSLDLKAGDADILFDALKDMNIVRRNHRLLTDEQLREYCERTVASGKINVVAGQEHIVRDVQQAYAKAAVNKAAGRMGGKVQAKDKNRLTLSR